MIKKIKGLIVDDEMRAINSLSLIFNKYINDVEVIGYANNVPEAVLKINELEPDVVFLDIEMPEYNGFELLNFFKEVTFEIVFITAYNDYAIKAFEVAAVDYLLKPVDVEKLKKAVNKTVLKIESKTKHENYEVLKSNVNAFKVERIALPKNDGFCFVKVDSIIALEADGGYSKLYLSGNKKEMVSKKIKFFEDILIDRPEFFRPHRSFMINLNYMQSYLRGEGSIVMEENHIISIARERKADFEQYIKMLKMVGTRT